MVAELVQRFPSAEYYARNLKAYYAALTIGPCPNHHLGRAEADITGWIAYFIEGLVTSFEKVHAQAKIEAQSGAADRSQLLRDLDATQRKALTLFEQSREVTAKEIVELFGFPKRHMRRFNRVLGPHFHFFKGVRRRFNNPNQKTQQTQLIQWTTTMLK